MEVMVKERRLFERFVARFPTKFKHSRENYGTDVFLRDASASGVRIAIKKKVFIHDSISLEVELPDGHDPLVLNGRVVWTREKTPNAWDAGVEFHKIHLMQMQRMFKIVNIS